jgi:hypothetical protein
VSIESLKKQAKNLKRLWPEFQTQHRNTEPALAACQELVARLHGYPCWHAIEKRSAEPSQPLPDSPPVEALALRREQIAKNTGALHATLDEFEAAQMERRFQSFDPLRFPARPLEAGASTAIELLISQVRLPADEAGRLLYQAVEHAYRNKHDGSATMILNVQTPTVPAFVTRGIQHFVAFGIKLVVVHKSTCSLDDDNTLAPQMMAAIDAAGGRGQAWHPLKRQLVQFQPSSNPY